MHLDGKATYSGNTISIIEVEQRREKVFGEQVEPEDSNLIENDV